MSDGQREAWARVANRITCPSGHTVGFFRRNVYVGEPLVPEDIGFSVTQGKVDTTGKIKPCAVCGQDWHRVVKATNRKTGQPIGEVLQVIVEGEWRTAG